MEDEETYVIGELTPSEALHLFLQVLQFLEWEEQRLIEFETWINTISRVEPFGVALLITWITLPEFRDYFVMELDSAVFTLTWHSISGEEDLSEEEFKKLPCYDITLQYCFPEDKNHKGEMTEPNCFLFVDGLDVSQVGGLEKATERTWEMCTPPVEQQDED